MQTLYIMIYFKNNMGSEFMENNMGPFSIVRNSKALIAVIIVLLVIIGGLLGTYFFYLKPKTSI